MPYKVSIKPCQCFLLLWRIYKSTTRHYWSLSRRQL